MELLTKKEAAAIARCCERTLDRAIKSGALVAYNHANVLIDRKDLIAWIKKNQIKAVRVGRPRKAIVVNMPREGRV